MSGLSPEDRCRAEALAAIPYANPFLPGRVELERRALGDRLIDFGPILRHGPEPTPGAARANHTALLELAGSLLSTLRAGLEAGRPRRATDLALYEDLSLFWLYSRHWEAIAAGLARMDREPDWTGPIPNWPAFREDFARVLRPPGISFPSGHLPEVLFAGFFQISRAFAQIHGAIAGGSAPAARLRAATWESIFTHDMRRYARTLRGRMGRLATLIVGPSGSGKELVAGAIGKSRLVPFDPASARFEAGLGRLYFPLNLSSLSANLIESELFGHKKGAFTTAGADRVGWLEHCGQHGSVFLDEIGELDGPIQVKLLRVLESRRFEPVGSTETRAFGGKVIAATNRDLAAEMLAGRFRQDLFYRLCADQVATPSLAEQLVDRPEDLPDLVRFVARDILGDDAPGEEVEGLAREVVAWVSAHLGVDYSWPGNFRELGQCTRNVMVRGSYHPPRHRPGSPAPAPADGTVAGLLESVRGATAPERELLGRYYALAYRRWGSYKAAGLRLGVDWRTIRDRLDRDFLAGLSPPPSHA